MSINSLITCTWAVGVNDETDGMETAVWRGMERKEGGKRDE